MPELRQRMMNRPFCQASENNKAPILAQLQRVFADRTRVLEIGSGTGQHAAHFAAGLPHLQWQPSDLPEQLPGIRAWAAAVAAANLFDPMALDVAAADWGVSGFDAAFTANTLHILSWARVEALFAGLAARIAVSGLLVVYGPFNYCGAYTSAGNARFDRWLRAGDTGQGIRDFEAVAELAAAQGFALREDNAMPANNRLLVWHRH